MRWVVGGLLCVLALPFTVAEVKVEKASRDGAPWVSLTGDRVRLEISLVEQDGSETLTARDSWLGTLDAEETSIAHGGDLALEIMFTTWRAPDRVHNADNPVTLTRAHFRLDRHELRDTDDGAELSVFMTSRVSSLELRLDYSLADDAWFYRRRLSVRDPEDRGHFLRWAWPLHAALLDTVSIAKPGGFGRPVAWTAGRGGGFAGLEDPAGTSTLTAERRKTTRVAVGQEIGQRIGTEWISSETAVVGLAPRGWLRLWFDRYLDTVRVAPPQPYLLYNTWYDVRSPEYTERREDVMNEANLLRIIGDFARVQRRHPGFQLDNFVLDDGWDVYESDWVLRPEEFPNGLAPIREALRELGAELGIWFGPIGGYSFRSKRVDWMRDHGYEAVGDQLCVAGTRYRDLLERRTVDFVRDDDVRYFKWDGFQFSCSEAGHGHPVDLYSRRAVMDSVIELGDAVRDQGPVFLNITSGTWLSPWWVRHADTIWMQGRDYGWADVPSISKRDAAITYRDVVLYENFGVNDFWFPMDSLMTHGIIKGHLQKLGGEAEPLDKFTDNAVLYFARGVAMWELYVSPNLLTDDEWSAIVDAEAWARDRFGTLMSTRMVGGDPRKGDAYGYTHFEDRRAIVAARNPAIERQTLRVELDPAAGLSTDAEDLVLERVYPTRWVSPRLFDAGDEIALPLGGFETAIYELYPLSEATEPLLADARFEVVQDGAREYAIDVIDPGRSAKLLNPESVASAQVAGVSAAVDKLELESTRHPAAVDDVETRSSEEHLEIAFTLAESVDRATLAVLVVPAQKGDEDPRIAISLDGTGVDAEIERQEGSWSWHKVPLDPGAHAASITVRPTEGPAWRGTVRAWVLSSRLLPLTRVTLRRAESKSTQRPMPPRPGRGGWVDEVTELGGAELGPERRRR